MYSGLGRLGQGASVSSCRSISSTILDAGRKMFSAAIALTLAEIMAETAAPTSAGWLCACAPIWNEPSSRSIRAALHGFTFKKTE